MKYLFPITLLTILASCGSTESEETVTKNEVKNKVVIDNDETAWMIDTTYYDWSAVEFLSEETIEVDDITYNLNIQIENDSDFDEDPLALNEGIYEWPNPAAVIQVSGFSDGSTDEVKLGRNIFVGLDIETVSDPISMDMEFFEEHRLIEFGYYVSGESLIVEFFYLFDEYIEEGAAVTLDFNLREYGTTVTSEIICQTCG